MRIESVTTAVVEANYDWTIVRVESDEGVCGWGEAFCALVPGSLHGTFLVDASSRARAELTRFLRDPAGAVP